jgi:hypothetical protein
MQTPYSTANGWKILAGQDVPDRRGVTTRYMLLHNPNAVGNKAAILTASADKRTVWNIYAEGKMLDMSSLFDKLDGGTLD